MLYTEQCFKSGADISRELGSPAAPVIESNRSGIGTKFCVGDSVNQLRTSLGGIVDRFVHGV